MRLQANAKYVCPTSGIGVKILGNVYYSPGYIKFKALVFEKHYGREISIERFKIPKNIPEKFKWEKI
jgi:hypothetical protein